MRLLLVGLAIQLGAYGQGDVKSGSGHALLTVSADRSIMVLLIDDDPADGSLDRAFGAKLKPGMPVPTSLDRKRVQYDSLQHQGIAFIVDPGQASQQRVVLKVRGTSWQPSPPINSTDQVFDTLTLTRHGVMNPSLGPDALATHLIERLRKQNR